MKQKKKSFQHESLQDVKTINKLLKSLIRGISKGVITFRDGAREIEMKPQGLLHLKLKATENEGRNQLTIQISWQTSEKRLKKGKALFVSSR